MPACSLSSNTNTSSIMNIPTTIKSIRVMNRILIAPGWWIDGFSKSIVRCFARSEAQPLSEGQVIGI